MPTNTKNPPDDDFPLSHLHARTQTPRKRTTFTPFFSQVALVREENVVGINYLFHMFGGRIFGAGSSSLSSSISGNVARSSMDETIFNTTQTRREGEAMMAWFLRRWAPLSEGLFDAVDGHILVSSHQTRQSPNFVVDERLMGVSAPTLLNQIIPSFSSESNSIQRYHIQRDSSHGHSSYIHYVLY
jgi:hypothetical protein